MYLLYVLVVCNCMYVCMYICMYVGNSIAFDHEIPAVPKYAPFIAAGFFFGPASFLHEVIKIPITSYLLCMYVCIYVCMFMLCTDDMQLLHRIYFYMTSVPNRYILSSLNTDDNNYANKTLSVCMYVHVRQVPFDPFLPWIFMGEEISMSARLWTAGYDIFSPTVNVLNHYYVRRHYPKFWESVNRLGCHTR